MRRVIVRAALLVGALLLGGESAAAQSCTTSRFGASGETRSCTLTLSTPNPTRYTNPMLVALDVAVGATSGTATQADYVAGRSAAVPVTLSVRGNRPWVVTVSGPAFWTASGPVARDDKPVGDLRYSLSQSGSGTPLSVTPATVFSGNAGPSVSRTLYWYTQLSWETDAPGAYAIEVTFTLTAP